MFESSVCMPEVAQSPRTEVGGREPANPIERRDIFSLVERILKDSKDLDRLLGEPAAASLVVPRLVSLGLTGYSIFAVALVIVFQSAGVWPQLRSMASWLDGTADALIMFAVEPTAIRGWTRWLDGSALAVWAGYCFGMIAAAGICLPSFYFFGLLAGIQTTMLEVVGHALKGIATTAVTLVGILPIYVAIVLGVIVFDARIVSLNTVLWTGLLLPFVAGLCGVESMYRGFVGLSERMTNQWRCRRECFLRRLLFSWSACYMAVSPIMIFTLWQAI